MVINTNISALNAADDLNQSNSALNASLARLSTGSQLVNASDNPAGLAESISLGAQINQTAAANSNVSNAVSFLQTQDGYLQQVGAALDQMSTLAVESQDVTKTDAERSDYQQEFSTLATYINNVAGKDFNGVSLFTTNTLNVTIDSDANTFANKGVDLGATTYSTLASDSIATVGDSSSGSIKALNDVKKAISQLGTDRAQIGSNIETLAAYSNQLSTLNNNLSAANSQITDVDVAQESTNYAKENILVQTGTAMLAQANALPQIALKLLG